MTAFVMCYFIFFLKGFKYLYLTPQDYTRISSTNSVHCHHVEEGGESRYVVCKKQNWLKEICGPLNFYFSTTLAV